MITEAETMPKRIEAPKPGIYENVPFDEYLAWRAYDPSLIKSGMVSMLQLAYDRDNPKEETDAMAFGTAVHCAVLEPDTFPMRYVLWDGGRRAGKTWEAFCEANEGKKPLNADAYGTCLACRNAVMGHPAAAPILTGCKEREVSLVWIDPATGLLCKGRIDLLGVALADLKTTTAHVGDDRALKRIATDLLYDLRMGAYHAGLSELRGQGTVPPVKLIFVEQKPPHDVRVKTMSDVSLAKGWDKWQEVLGRVAECEKTGRWPGCDPKESELEFWGGDDLGITLDGESIG